MAIADVLTASQELSDVIDALLTRYDGPSPAIPHADWAFNRFGAVQVMVRDRSGGTAAAAIARGLLEEAGYWDWAMATGSQADWMARLGVIEFQRLKARADPSDALWLEWILPPGRRFASDGGGVPSGSEVVKKLGQGFSSDRLAPFSMSGLFGVYKLVELVTHGSLAATLLLEMPDGSVMSDRLSAAVLHVAGAGASAIVASHLDLEATEQQWLSDSALDLAVRAAAVHGGATASNT
jgi:hypothetical protein